MLDSDNLAQGHIHKYSPLGAGGLGLGFGFNN
jgi:hypothetical protein